MADGVFDILNLTLVPYGNAHTSSSGKISCQHGNGECEGNRWEQCAIAHYPDPKDHFPFYYCMEKAGENMLTKVKSCATTAKMDYATLSTCWNGKESAQLQQRFGALTPSNHKYVPWVIVNGKEYQGSNLLKLVCSLYKGAKPAGCSKATSETVLTLTEIPDLDMSALLDAAANATHYGDPASGCESDEVSIQITGVKGDACVPKCTTSACPTDKPAGVTATPQCALQSSTGDKYCALICSPSAEALSFPAFKKAADAQCGTNASCKAIQTVGICTYDD